MNNFTLIASRDYVNDLTTEVRRAKHRVYGLTLLIADDSSTKELSAALRQAAKIIDINIAIDAFTYSELGGAFSLKKKQKASSLAVTNMLAQLSIAGAKTYILNNRPRLNPFKGVTHIKWFIVDDFVYCFGGVNLYKSGIESSDYMLKIKNKKLANILVKQQKDIISCDRSGTNYPGLDLKLPLGHILIDNGKQGSSIIYERAYRLAAQSREITLVSQYCPTGKLVRHLKSTPSKIYFNPPRVAASRKNKILIRGSMLRTGLKTAYQKDTYIHAKFIIFLLKNGKKIALTGSHNFAYSGVALGTKEVALETSDLNVIEQLESFLQKYIV